MMSLYKNILLFSLILAVFYANTVSGQDGDGDKEDPPVPTPKKLKCHVCDSKDNKDCVEYDYKLKGEAVEKECSEEDKSCIKEVFQSLDKRVKRGCSKTECKDEKGCASAGISTESLGLAKTFTCSKDLCNDSTSIKNNKFVLFSLGLVSTSLFLSFL